MAKDKERIRRRFSDYVQKLAMHGVSGSEVESGEGTHSVRVISPRTVLPYYANLRRCKETGRHSSEPGGCGACQKRFQQIVEVVVIEDGGATAEMAEDTRADEKEAAALASLDGWSE